MRKDFKDPLKKLAVINGHLSSAMRAMSDVAGMAGKTPLDEESQLIGPLGEENVGEVMFSLMTMLIPMSKKVEGTTNYLRKLEGLKPNDYSKSISTIALNNLTREFVAVEVDPEGEQTEGGSPV